MSKRRIVAIVVLILIGILYLATLVLAFIDSSLARSFLMAALFCTIVLPGVAYGYLIFVGRLGDKERKEKETADEDDTEK